MRCQVGSVPLNRVPVYSSVAIVQIGVGGGEVGKELPAFPLLYNLIWCESCRGNYDFDQGHLLAVERCSQKMEATFAARCIQ